MVGGVGTGFSTATADDGEPLWGLGGLLIIKVAGSNGARFSLIEERMPLGVATPLHAHPNDEETFIVLEGELAIWSDGQWSPAPAGTIVHVERGDHPHAWRVQSELARTLVITTPEHEQFYRACCDPAPSCRLPDDAGRLDLERIRRAAAAHGVQILGPTPD